MKTLVRIFTQYSENYGWNEEGTEIISDFWKYKGEVQFELHVDADHFMYDEQNCIAAIKALLAEQSNKYAKYEYISHELVFHTPTKLDENRFTAMLALAHMSNKN